MCFAIFFEKEAKYCRTIGAVAQVIGLDKIVSEDAAHIPYEESETDLCLCGIDVHTTFEPLDYDVQQDDGYNYTVIKRVD